VDDGVELCVRVRRVGLVCCVLVGRRLRGNTERLCGNSQGYGGFKSFFSFFVTSNRKNWRLEKIGDSGTKPVILKYCNCTKYCKHLATAGEITQQES